MTQKRARGRSRGRLSLSVRLSLLVLFAALVPLAAVVGINDYFARNTLLKQAQAALTTDATSKVTLLDNYLRERLSDGVALASLPTAIEFLACNANPATPQLDCQNQQNVQYRPSVGRALHVGPVKDPNYSSWSIYDTRGTLLLSSDLSLLKTGGAPVPAEDLAPVQADKQWISAVSYDPAVKHAFVRLYSPIRPIDPSTLQRVGPVLGFLEATLRLDYVWSIVAKEKGAVGSGSYAFIADENGIRVADSSNANLFTALRPLDAKTLALISSEQRYGSNAPPSQLDLPEVQQSLTAAAAQDSFQGVAAPGGSARYQFIRVQMGTVPWSYFVLSPLSTVTAVTDDQLRTSLLSAGVIAVLAILIGLLVGRGTTRPVRSSVTELEGAAAALKALASRQEGSAGEQQWVVDACKTGLEGVRYLSDAMNQAAKRIIDASNWFGDYWDRLTEDQARRTVQHLTELAHYIDEAARRQAASSERLDKAITVTMQVSDQLVAGATAAADSAGQLEQVVGDLQHVVGGSRRPPAGQEAVAGQRVMDAPRQMSPEPPRAAPPRQIAAPSPQQQQPRMPAQPLRGAPSGWPSSADPGAGTGGGWPGYAPNAPYGHYDGNGNGSASYGGDGYQDYSGNGYNGNGYNGNGYGGDGGYPDLGNGAPWNQQMPPGPGQDPRRR